MAFCHLHIARKVTLVLLAGLCLLVSACKNEPGLNAEDRRCKTFFEGQFQLYTHGEAADAKGIIKNIDSFYAKHNTATPLCRSIIYSSKSMDYYLSGEYDTGLLYADSALNIIEQHKDQPEIESGFVNALVTKARLLFATNHFSQAYNYFFMARQLSEASPDSCRKEVYNYGLAMVSYKQKKYADAAEFFKATFKYRSFCDAQAYMSLQEVLDDIALCYEHMHKLDSAIFYYDSTLTFIARNFRSASVPFTRRAEAVVYGNKGGVMMEKGQTDSAIALLRRSYDINIQPHYDNTDALLTHLKLAKAYLKKNDLPLLNTTLADLRRELDTIAHPLKAIADWKELMYQYYDKTGNSEQAFHFYREFASLRDSLWDTEKDQLQNDMNKELRDNEQAFNISMLQKQSQMHSLYLWIAISAAVLLAVIFVLVYINYSRGKRSIQKLTLLNTRVKEQKKQLERTTDKLRQSNHDMDNILHIVAHDLRNPISVITMASTLIREETTDETIKEPLDMVLSASNSATVLIGELLEFSSDVEKGADLKKERSDINELIQDAATSLKFKASDKKQVINVLLPPQPLFVNVNREKIKRVLGNLVSNAIKFSPTNAEIIIMARSANNRVVIEVKDHGIGIPQKLLPLIFNTFTTAKREGTAGEPSFGLGLSICRQIVDAHGGKIWAESEQEKGSSFFIELPAA